MPKIFHTSDIHIGSQFIFLADKAEKYRSLIKSSFARLVDLCIEERAGALLISGDLFDTNFPSDSNISFVQEQFKKLSDAQIKVFLIAGNHDYFIEGSVYDRGLFEDFTNVKVFIPPFESIVVPELNATIYGVSNTTNKSLQHPLQLLKKVENETKYHIALVHGSMQITGKDSDSNLPITQEEIRTSRLDYIALGDWHGNGDYSAGETKCFYSGSLEPIDFSQVNAGFVMEIDLNEAGITTKPRRIGTIKVNNLNYEFSSRNDLGRLRSVLTESSDSNTVMILTLSGDIETDLANIIAELTADFETQYYFLRINDKTAITTDSVVLEKYKDDPIVERFINNIEEFAVDVSEDDVKDLAIKYGIGSLENKNR